MSTPVLSLPAFPSSAAHRRVEPQPKTAAPVTPSAAADKPLRDPRVDFFRGLALLTIFTTHLNPNWVKKVSPTAFGFWDSAELFIFLSGYVTGLIYLKLVDRSAAACFVKAALQCGRLYVANACAMVVTLGCLGLIYAAPRYDLALAGRLIDDPGRALADFTRLAYFPWTFDILPLYICLLAMLPVMVLVARYAGVLMMVLLSFFLYFLVQLDPAAVDLPEPWGAAWYFNPFAWQFLFFLGVASSQVVKHQGALVPQRRWVCWLAIAGVVVGGLMKVGLALAYDPQFFAALQRIFVGGEAEALPMLGFTPVGTGKMNLEPVRLVNFACLVAAATILVPRVWKVWDSRVATWVIRCGQQSLVIFCVHSFLVNVMNQYLETHATSLGLQVAANVVGWGLLLLAGNVLHHAHRLTRGRGGE